MNVCICDPTKQDCKNIVKETLDKAEKPKVMKISQNKIFLTYDKKEKKFKGATTRSRAKKKK